MSDFDPIAILGALERHRAAYVLIGDLAGVLHGTDLFARRVEIVPSLKLENIERLERVLSDLDVPDPKSVRGLGKDHPLTVNTSHGELDLTPEPPGSAGYPDLRRAAERQPLGRGLRPTVASAPDLVRTIADGHDPALGPRLRRIMELERTLAPEM